MEEEQKKAKKIAITRKTAWIIFVAVMIVVIGAGAVFAVVENVKNKSQETSAGTEIADLPDDMMNQNTLVDTSQMSEEELKKLNEEETKKAQEEEKKKQENKNTTKKNTTNTATVNTNQYYIKVNYGAQTVTVYTKDANGKYTVPVRACICSTGAATPPSGVYRLAWKTVWGLLYGNVWGHYCCQVVGDILFHSVPYNQARNDTLVSKYYDRLGSKDSMGCIRLTTIDAKWIYENCPSGTQVEFYSSSNPGPLGKPSARKVSSAPGNLKNWDPTDPDPRNPWIEYIKNENNQNIENNKDNTSVENTDNTNNPPVDSGISGETTPVTPNIPNNPVVDNTETNNEGSNTGNNNEGSNTGNNNEGGNIGDNNDNNESGNTSGGQDNTTSQEGNLGGNSTNTGDSSNNQTNTGNNSSNQSSTENGSHDNQTSTDDGSNNAEGRTENN